MRRASLTLMALLALAPMIAAAGATSAAAATQVVVTPNDPQGWCWTQPCADTRPGGTVSFVADPTAPGSPNHGALEFTTDATTTAKAQAVHSTATWLANVSELSYWTKQVSGPLVADPAYQLAICANGLPAGTCAGFTTLVFEPYQNGTIIPGAWQFWDVAAAGRFWSTRSVTCSNGALVGSAGGPALYTLANVQAMCPQALVFQFIANVGSNNPLYTVRTDLFNFNGTVYNFEPTRECGEQADTDNDEGHDTDVDREDGEDHDDVDSAASCQHDDGDHGDGGGSGVED